ncbi:MAG: hypothetical protein ACJA0C_000809 [Candidatus Endobugula sp.]|jgi:hypothetical protein
MNINTILPTSHMPNNNAANTVLRSAISEESTGSQQELFVPIEQASQVDRSQTTASDASKTQERSQEQQQLTREIAKKETQQQEKIDQQTIQSLSTLDREVRNHERAHAAVGGQYAGAPSYEYERGPDGVNYAVSGEVPISTGATSDPQMTIEKAQIIRRAALAPAEPSAQDRKVAAEATQMEAEARVDIVVQEREVRMQEEQAMNEQRNAVDSEQSQSINARAAQDSDAVDDINETQEHMFNEINDDLAAQLVSLGGAQQQAQTLGSIVSRFA